MDKGRSRAALMGAMIVGAYALVAVLYSWPLPLHFSTHITGSTDGDAGVYVWNLWVFRYELMATTHWPFETSRILDLAAHPGLGLHNYTVLADIVSLPLQDRLGLIPAFNTIYLGLHLGAALATFLLVRHVGVPKPEAWLAGILFGFSPILTARGTAHYSLLAALPLPLFLLFVLKAGASLRFRHAAAAGLVMGLSIYCDPYYLVFCFLVLAFAAVYAPVSLTWQSVRATPVTNRAAFAFAAVAAILGLVSLIVAVTGGTHFDALGSHLSVTTIYTPMLVLTGALGGFALCRVRPRIALVPFPWRRASALLGAGLAVALVVMAPVLWALSQQAFRGRFVSPRILWRSSPAGVDLLAFLMPNPNHALFGEPLRAWLARRRADDFVEDTAALGLTAVVVVGLALFLRRPRAPRFWTAFAVTFGLLALGPFVWVGGLNTGVPGPWAILRFVPGIGLARSPTRLAVLAALGFAVLFAFALNALSQGGKRRRPAILMGVGALLLFELAPCPRPLFSAEIPAVYDVIARDPCDVSVLELPFGVRDGTDSVGSFSARSQFHQIAHGKRLLGGYLSRISQRTVGRYRRFPVLNAFLTLSQGMPLTPEQAEAAHDAAPRFLAWSHLGFVVIDGQRASPKLQRFAVNALNLIKVAEEWPYAIYVPDSAVCGWPGAATSEARAACIHGTLRCPKPLSPAPVSTALAAELREEAAVP